MYPNEILPGIDLYTIFLCIAVVAAIVVYRLLADKMNIEARLQNLCIFTAVAAVVGGYASAVVFQAFYNIKKDGGFVINAQTGATFYGGLIGGAGIFLLIYFIAGGKMFPEKTHLKRFFNIADIAACSITAAHAIGRIGCLMAGCCHGMKTDAWFGIRMQHLGYKVIPTQLFEAVFLALLLVYLLARIKDKQTYCLQIYMGVYGIWRFIVEFLRGDYRGTTIVSTLTPSQLTAIIMVFAAVLLIFAQKRLQSASSKASADPTFVGNDDGYEYDEEYDYDYGEKSEDKTEDQSEKQD